MATKHLYRAFGELKTINAWASDPRCRVTRQGLYARVFMQGLSIEEAFRKGAHAPKHSHTNSALRLVINGVSKTVPQWARASRCKVTITTIRQRLADGWPPDAAVLYRPYAAAPPGVPHAGRKGGRPSAQLVAWGETKTLARWSQDPRARVVTQRIKQRLAEGYTPEEAISTPPWQRFGERVRGSNNPCPQSGTHGRPPLTDRQ